MVGLNYGALTPEQRAGYFAALSHPAQDTGLRVSVLNLNHVHQADISRDVTGEGSLTLDRNNDINRSCTIGLNDLDGELADLDLRHLVRVEHGLKVPALGEWVFTPLITGRVMVPTDNGATASLELHGKESFGLLPGAPIRKWGKGRTVAGVIRDMFEDIGEEFIRVSPNLLGAKAPKLGKVVHTGGPDEKKAPTRVARRLAAAHNMQVFWDAMGVLVIRRPPSNPLATWSEADEGERDSITPIVSPVQWSRDLREVRNVVQAKGKKKVGPLRVAAPDDHIWSPDSLKRGPVGARKPGRLVHYWTDTSIAREAVLRRRAKKVLARLLTEKTSARFEAVPVFHVGPHDLIEARRRDGRWGQWWLSEASVPLDTGGNMTVGYLPNVRMRRR